jgi:uncharacterized ferritin-like protein (DUF455 family)
MAACLFAAALECLREREPAAKVARTREAAAAFARGELRIDGAAGSPLPITMPGRPARPRLVHPRELPQRGLGSIAGRAAFLHAIAHIEFNAIDLAWDAVYRFRGLPEDYYQDWTGIADDEARHFRLLRARLNELGADYGDFDAHNGLWEMAEKTADDLVARMALVPRLLEARGLDVTPGMIARLRGNGDTDSAQILELILREEVAHVAAGSRWFAWACAQRGCEPGATFAALLREHAHGALRGPFNWPAREAAGFDARERELLEGFTA